MYPYELSLREARQWRVLAEFNVVDARARIRRAVMAGQAVSPKMRENLSRFIRLRAKAREAERQALEREHPARAC